MKHCCLPLLIYGTAVVAWATDPTGLPVMGPPLAPGAGEVNFSLVPKAFQRNPELAMTAICEVTDFGRTLPPASPEHPVYYVISDTGYHPLGDVVGGEKLPGLAYLDHVMEQSLAANGFRLAGPHGPRPSLAIFYFWGSAYRMDVEMAADFHELDRRQVQERAVLVGGKKFLRQIITTQDFGDSILDHTAKRTFLDYQATHDLYYVVASAYDYLSLSHGDRRLAWRTSMTVNAQGVALADTLPALVLTAAPYFGHDMSEPEALRRRVELGSVLIGPMKVIESDVPLPGPAKNETKQDR